MGAHDYTLERARACVCIFVCIVFVACNRAVTRLSFRKRAKHTLLIYGLEFSHVHVSSVLCTVLERVDPILLSQSIPCMSFGVDGLLRSSDAVF